MKNTLNFAGISIFRNTKKPELSALSDKISARVDFMHAGERSPPIREQYSATGLLFLGLSHGVHKFSGLLISLSQFLLKCAVLRKHVVSGNKPKVSRI